MDALSQSKANAAAPEVQNGALWFWRFLRTRVLLSDVRALWRG